MYYVDGDYNVVDDDYDGGDYDGGDEDDDDAQFPHWF